MDLLLRLTQIGTAKAPVPPGGENILLGLLLGSVCLILIITEVMTNFKARTAGGGAGKPGQRGVPDQRQNNVKDNKTSTERKV